MGTCTKKKNEITITMIVDLIPISKTTYNNHKQTCDFKELYKMFESDVHTVSEKRTFLYCNFPELDEQTKDKIWVAFIDGVSDKFYEGDEDNE